MLKARRGEEVQNRNNSTLLRKPPPRDHTSAMTYFTARPEGGQEQVPQQQDNGGHIPTEVLQVD